MTRYMLLAMASIIAGGLAHAGDVENPMIASAAWDDIRYDVIGDVTPQLGDTPLMLEAPYRAHDAATVPVHLVQTDPSATIDEVTLVVDENPAPVVADIAFGDAMMPLDFETRIRINQYSNVRAIARTSAGPQMTGRYVKASGGCSAPATRDPAQALAAMGEMRMRYFDISGDAALPQSKTRREAQVMIRHPNYSGLQRDQVSQLFIPAHFIDRLEVLQGDEPLFSLTGGISISENPVFRFTYNDNGSEDFTIRAHDTEGNVFEERIPKAPAS